MNDPTKKAKAVLHSRLLMLDKLRNSEKHLAALLKYYKYNPSDFVNDWMVTYDPRNIETPYLPFVLFPKQQELISWIQERVSTKTGGIVEKTRDFGASYVCMAYSIHALIFQPGVKIAFGSRKEKLVDELGNPDSLFEKARIILDYLPNEFIPDNLKISFLKIVNEDNGAAITGEAGDNIGRGGRNSIYFVDESAFLERPDKVEAALSMNSDVRIDVSTFNGVGNPFYKKWASKKHPIFICDWRDDPRKNQEWYDKQVEIFEPWIVAQEIDRDPYASIEGLCIPAKYVKAAIDFPLKAEGEKIAGFDIADEGKDANALCLRHGPVVLKVDTWKKGTTTESSRNVWGICKDKNYDRCHYESNGVGAGVKGEMKSIKELDKSDFKMRVVGINPGSTDLPGFWAPGKLNRDMFLNIRVKLWWTLRRKFKRTYQRKYGIKNWPDEKCISIPNDNQLILELSQPLIERNEAGKLQLESKKKMKKRGIKSGNKADSLMLTEYKPRVVYVS